MIINLTTISKHLVYLVLLFCFLSLTQRQEALALQVAPISYISSVAWSPDGSKIAIGFGTDFCVPDRPDLYTIQILDAASRNLIQSLVGSECNITSIDWSLDGTKLAATSLDGVGTRVWDVQSGQLIMKAKEGGQGVNLVRWKPDDNAQLAVATAASAGILILNPVTGETLTLAPISGNFLDWSPDGKKLVSGDAEMDQVYIADMVSKRQIMALDGHSMGVGSVDWSPNGRMIASMGGDGTLIVWDATNGRQIFVVTVPNIVQVRWSPDSLKIATASFDGLVQVWNASTGQLLNTTSYPSGRVYAVDWSPDGTQLAYGGTGQIFEVISAPNIPTPTPTATATPTPPTPTSAAFPAANVLRR